MRRGFVTLTATTASPGARHVKTGAGYWRITSMSSVLVVRPWISAR